MKKPRVMIAEFQHETNCFCPNKAGRKEFEQFYLKDSDEVIPYLKGTGTTMGGIIEASENEGFEIIPIMAAFAMPTGLVTREMFEFTKNKIVRAVKDIKNIDGILLSLHGAMVSEATLDGEGDLLKAIRDIAGSAMPIVTTLDLHGNVTDAMVENADAFFPYENYPHTDCFQRGYEAGKCIAKMIRHEVSPVTRLRHIPILSQTIETTGEPHLELLNKVHKWEENPKVINVATMHGFAWADIPDARMSVMAITDGDTKLAEDIVDDMAKTIWERRDKFIKKYPSPEEAVEQAMEFPSGPVIIADTADNPGGGGTGDSTFILRALLKAGAKNVGFAIIPDPEAVQQAISAGIGSTVTLSLGGKLGPKEITSGPVEVIATVKTIADGQFVNKGPMFNGLLNNIGRTVVLDTDGIEIIVPERRMQPFDAEIFRRVGIEPSEKKIIVLKSSIHFKGSFGSMAKKILYVDTPEYLTMNFESLNFKNISRPVYPLDKDFRYVI